MNPNGSDEHLRAALKHAPDATTQPPAHVTAQILAAAHRSAAEPAPRAGAAQLPWWRRPWGASGALASLLMAGFIGLLWRGEAPGPQIEETTRAEAPAVQPAVAPAAAPVARVDPAPSASPPPAAPPAANAKARAAAPSAQTPKAVAEPAVVMAESRAAESVAPTPAAPAAPPARAALRLAAAPTPRGPTLEPGDKLAWLGDATLSAPDQAWLNQLAAAGTASPARAAKAAADQATVGANVPAANAASPVLQLRWERSGQLLGSWRVAGDEVTWCPAAQPCQVQVVPEAALKTLLDALRQGGDLKR